MKRLVLDLDGTITIDDPMLPYAEKLPDLDVVEKIREYKALGFDIIIFSARNMRAYKGSVGKINAITLPEMINWLSAHCIPYDEIHIGKPWCGHDGFYVDDKAIRPSEFRDMPYQDIMNLLSGEGDGGYQSSSDDDMES